jgi:hypothetical protein
MEGRVRGDNDNGKGFLVLGSLCTAPVSNPDTDIAITYNIMG